MKTHSNLVTDKCGVDYFCFVIFHVGVIHKVRVSFRYFRTGDFSDEKLNARKVRLGLESPLVNVVSLNWTCAVINVVSHEIGHIPHSGAW